MNAIVHTSSIEEAITLADIMFEDNPEPPETSDEHETAAVEDLAERISHLSAPLSIDAALASEDWRGVEHRGKGSSRGGQFVQHGQGEADVEGSAPGYSGDVVELAPEGGERAKQTGYDDEGNPMWVEGWKPASLPEQEEIQAVEESLLTPSYTQEEKDLFDTIIGMYSSERQEGARNLMYGPANAIRPLGGGVHPSKIIELAQGGHGVFKALSDEKMLRTYIESGTYWRRNIAFSVGADILGPEYGKLVPTTVPRKSGGRMGSMQHFIEGSVPAYQFGKEEDWYGSDEDLARAAILDYMFGSTDRKYDNWVMSKKGVDSSLIPDEEVLDMDMAALREREEGGAITPDTTEGNISLIDNDLSFPGFDSMYDYVNTAMLNRAVSDNLPMPDVTDIRDKWPKLEAAWRHIGIEDLAIHKAKNRFNWVTTSGVKRIGDLRDPFSNAPKDTIRELLKYTRRLRDPRPGREKHIEEELEDVKLVEPYNDVELVEKDSDDFSIDLPKEEDDA